MRSNRLMRVSACLYARHAHNVAVKDTGNWALFVAIAACFLGVAALVRTRGLRPVNTTDGLRAWFRVSMIFATASGLGLAALVGFALKFAVVTERVGGVLAPLGVVVAAALASAGAARTLIAQSEAAQVNRVEDSERLLWTRFGEASTQFVDTKHFAIRAAGVYSLGGLADDWFRHHKRLRELGIEGRDEVAEAETIVDTLCAYLRQNTHRKAGLPAGKASEEAIINEAIIGQFGVHLKRSQGGKTPASPDGVVTGGLWAAKGLILDLRGADVSSARWSGIDLRSAVLRDADLYDTDLPGADLTDADLRGADLRKADLRDAALDRVQLARVIFDGETLWPPNQVIPGDARRVPDGTPHTRSSA